MDREVAMIPIEFDDGVTYMELTREDYEYLYKLGNITGHKVIEISLSGCTKPGVIDTSTMEEDMVEITEASKEQIDKWITEASKEDIDDDIMLLFREEARKILEKYPDGIVSSEEARRLLSETTDEEA